MPNVIALFQLDNVPWKIETELKLKTENLQWITGGFIETKSVFYSKWYMFWRFFSYYVISLTLCLIYNSSLDQDMLPWVQKIVDAICVSW